MPIDLMRLIDKIKAHPNYHQAGMILCHNGVVRQTSRDGRPVSGLTIAVDHDKLHRIIEENKARPGILEILIEIVENRRLSVGDDVMVIVIAGDIRERVIATMTDTLNAVKSTVTKKTEHFF